jgi:hypothetical protein
MCGEKAGLLNSTISFFKRIELKEVNSGYVEPVLNWCHFEGEDYQGIVTLAPGLVCSACAPTRLLLSG